ncbi:MAG: hypothetical protein FJ144_09345 [Deltaproteobacteria bacterium]|nr:hypothetical protein [Deltaproteobacteria bacterium]
MKPTHSFRCGVFGALVLALVGSACSGSSGGSPSCNSAVAAAAETCVQAASAAHHDCYLATGGACPAGNAALAEALSTAEDEVTDACSAADAAEAGFGPLFTPETLAERVQASCRAESASLASRSFGGPHGHALGNADASERACLESAHTAGADLIDAATSARNACLQSREDGGACDATSAEGEIAAAAASAESAIESACPNLSSLVAVSAETFVARALAQADCSTAASWGDSSPFALECGPRPEVGTPPRGEYMQVVLDESVWGTRCGDGSPFAFWVRLAPEGAPVENVVVGMQGGGVCVFEDDCATRPAGLFSSLEDQPEQTGPMSNDPSINPLADYTKVYLPYCNQDVFIGGGATSDFDAITVHRYGALNVRAALRWVRDAIWRELDATTAEGYTPDRMRVYFGGFSAGAFGTIYNYHYLLDDLQWARTTAFSDAGLALDSGQTISVAALGAILISNEAPLGWGSGEQLPPYCIETDCGLGPKVLARSAPRLLAVPEQQLMILSNQNDSTQVSTTFFPDTPSWINELRRSYCETKDLPGVSYFLPPIPESIHVISPRNELYTELAVDGEIMRDWLAAGHRNPTAVADRVAEGDMVAAIPGVEPFPCEVEP